MANDIRVVVLDDYHQRWLVSDPFRQLASRLSVTVYDRPADSADEVVRRLQGVPIVVAIRERTRFPRELLQRLPDLELIAQTGNHAYHIDLEAASQLGVAVGLLPGGDGGTAGTAELTVALMLAILRQLGHYDRLLHQGGWEVPYGRVLAGMRVGLVGAGRIAQAVARRLQAFEVELVAWSPSLTPERAAAMGARALPLEELFRTSDVVSIHLPLKPQTRGFISARLLDLMKPQAYLINTSRGAIVDEDHLVRRLQERRLAGAGLDVFVEEPLPPEHPLRRLDNVVLTPHAGWVTDQAYAAFAEKTATMIRRYLEGDTGFVVNPKALEHPRFRDPSRHHVGRWRSAAQV